MHMNLSWCIWCSTINIPLNTTTLPVSYCGNVLSVTWTLIIGDVCFCVYEETRLRSIIAICWHKLFGSRIIYLRKQILNQTFFTFHSSGMVTQIVSGSLLQDHMLCIFIGDTPFLNACLWIMHTLYHYRTGLHDLYIGLYIILIPASLWYLVFVNYSSIIIIICPKRQLHNCVAGCPRSIIYQLVNMLQDISGVNKYKCRWIWTFTSKILQ